MTFPNFELTNLKFNPPPTTCEGTYFACALANWAMNYNRRTRPPDCWYLVRIKQPWPPPNHQLPKMEFMIIDKKILARFRHPSGRLFYKSELYPVCNRLNQDDLVIMAVSLKPGGLTEWVHKVTTKALTDFEPMY